MDKLREKITGIIGDALLDAGTKIPNKIADKILALLPHWISVEDRLPEETYHVLVTTKNGTRMVGYLRRGVWQDTIMDCDFFAPITHWQPLPQPPKEG